MRHSLSLSLSDLSPVPEVEQVPVNSGAPLHLPCDTGASLPPQGVQWSKDGSRLEGSLEVSFICIILAELALRQWRRNHGGAGGWRPRENLAALHLRGVRAPILHHVQTLQTILCCMLVSCFQLMVQRRIDSFFGQQTVSSR